MAVSAASRAVLSLKLFSSPFPEWEGWHGGSVAAGPLSVILGPPTEASYGQAQRPADLRRALVGAAHERPGAPCRNDPDPGQSRRQRGAVHQRLQHDAGLHPGAPRADDRHFLAHPRRPLLRPEDNDGRAAHAAADLPRRRLPGLRRRQAARPAAEGAHRLRRRDARRGRQGAPPQPRRL